MLVKIAYRCFLSIIFFYWQRKPIIEPGCLLTSCTNLFLMIDVIFCINILFFMSLGFISISLKNVLFIWNQLLWVCLAFCADIVLIVTLVLPGAFTMILNCVMILFVFFQMILYKLMRVLTILYFIEVLLSAIAGIDLFKILLFLQLFFPLLIIP